jgi:hypothetical protein
VAAKFRAIGGWFSLPFRLPPVKIFCMVEACMEKRKHDKNPARTSPWAFFSTHWEQCGEPLGDCRAEGHSLDPHE